jgi:hypothetical protein
MPQLPPVDAASWLDHQRQRAAQIARDRIASVGAVPQDWISQARRSIAGLIPAPVEPPPPPDIVEAPPPPPPAPMALAEPEEAFPSALPDESMLAPPQPAAPPAPQSPIAGLTSGIGSTFSGIGAGASSALSGARGALAGANEAATGGLNAAAAGAGGWVDEARQRIAGLGDAFITSGDSTPARLTPPVPQDATQSFFQQSTLAPGVDPSTPTGVTPEAPVAPPPGVQGVRDFLGAARDTAGTALTTASRYLPGNIGPALAEDVLSGIPYRLRDDLTASPLAKAGSAALDTVTAPVTAYQEREDGRMARAFLGYAPGDGQQPPDVDAEAWRWALDDARRAGAEAYQTGIGSAGMGIRVPRVPLVGRIQNLSQANEVLASGPLTSPRSLAQNITGGGVRTLERLALRLLSGAPWNTVPEVAGEVRAMAGEVRPALGRARTAFQTGPTPRNPGATGVAGAADALVNAPDAEAQLLTSGIRANAATDEVWRSLGEAAGRATGTRRGLTGAALDDFVREAGNYVTVTGPNSPLASGLNTARAWMSDPAASPAQRVTGYIANGFAPYVGMPERMLGGTFQTVLGPAEAPLELGIRTFLRNKGVQGALTPALREQLVGRAMLGTVFDTTMAWQAHNGNLYGRPPTDPAKRREAERQGARWNSLRVAGQWVPLTYLGTLGTSAGLVADATHAAEDAQAAGKPFPEIAAKMINRAASFALDESYLSDFADFLKATGDEKFLTGVTALGAGYASRPLAAVTGLANAADPYARETNTPQGQLARVAPGGRQQLPTKVDPYTGEDVRRQGSGLGRYLGLNAGEEITPLERELAAHGVTLTPPRGDYAGAAQTMQAHRAIQRAVGSEVGEAARTVIASRTYQQASDAEKTKLLERAVRQARQLADVRLGETVKRDAKRQADYEYLAVPRYDGIAARLGADEIRRENLRTAAARSALTAAKQKYPDNPDKGRAELLRSDPETVKLAENRPPLAASELRRKREQVYARNGLNASGDPLEEEPS